MSRSWNNCIRCMSCYVLLNGFKHIPNSNWRYRERDMYIETYLMQTRDIFKSIKCLFYREVIGGQLWWRHQMETFSALQWSFGEGNPPVTGGLPSQRQVTRSFEVFFDPNGWANNRDAVDLRRNSAHYDVTVLLCVQCIHVHLYIISFLDIRATSRRFLRRVVKEETNQFRYICILVTPVPQPGCEYTCKRTRIDVV